MIRANALYENQYFLGTRCAASHPKRQVEIALKEKADGWRTDATASETTQVRLRA